MWQFWHWLVLFAGRCCCGKDSGKDRHHATVINPYYITGQDTELLEQLKSSHKAVITLEDGVLDGGFGEKIARFYGDSAVKTRCYGLKKEFLDRYDAQEVLRENRLTAEQIAEDVAKML